MLCRFIYPGNSCNAFGNPCFNKNHRVEFILYYGSLVFLFPTGLLPLAGLSLKSSIRPEGHRVTLFPFLFGNQGIPSFSLYFAPTASYPAVSCCRSRGSVQQARAETTKPCA